MRGFQVRRYVLRHTLSTTLGVTALGVAATAIPGIPALAAETAMQGTLQQRVAVDTRVMADNNHVADATRVVTLKVDKVSLKEAVMAIAENSGVRIQFQLPVVEAVTVPVTLHADKLPMATALDRVLVGTGLRYVWTARNIITIRSATEMGDEQQNDGTIVGRITSGKTKQPVAGATVLLDENSRGVVTDEDGVFRLRAAAGEHTVHVRAVGFTRQNKRVTVTQDQDMAVAFVLEPSASVLDEVIVTGTVVATERKAVTTPITVITAEELEKRNVTRIEQLFRGEVPGIVALDLGTQSYTTGLGNSRSSYIYSRGSSSLVGRTPTPIKTYIDGVELLDPSYLGTIDPRSIERIEIVTGPQAATIYGSGAMGGVMQIFTKRGSRNGRPEVTLNLRYGMLQSNLSNGYTPAHNDALLVSGGSGPEFSYSVNGSYGYTGKWQPGLYNRTMGLSGGVTHKRGVFQLGGTVGVSTGENGSYGSLGGNTICVILNQVCYGTLVGRMLAEQGDLPPNANNAGFFDQQVSRSLAQQLAFDIDVRPFQVWQHHLTVGRSYNKFSSDPTAPTFIEPSDSLFQMYWSEGARMTTNYNTTLASRFGVIAPTFTVTGNYSSGQQSTYYGCALTEDATDYVGCYPGASGVYSSRSIDDKNWGGSGLLRVGFWDKLYVSFGLRGERNPTYGTDHPVDWTPTEGITYTIERGDLTLKLLASYGSATRSPSASQRKRYYSTGSYQTPYSWIQQFENPDLGPEHSHGPQGGFELYYGNWGSITLNRYDQRVTDLIQYIPIDSTQIVYEWSPDPQWQKQYQYQNAATVRQHGWETTASLNFGPLSFKGTYSMTESRTLHLNSSAYSPYTEYGVGETRGGIPTHFGSFNVSYAHGPTSVTWTGNYVGSSIQYNSMGIWAWVDAYTRIQTYRYRQDYYWAGVGSTPGYLKHDLAASHRLSRSTSLLLNVTNLADDHGSDMTALFPSLGRQTQLGVSIRFM